MTAYIIRRILLMIPTLFLVTVIVFAAIRFVPGDVVMRMVRERGGMAETTVAGLEVNAEYIRARLGLDVPVHVQYWRWVSGIVRGDPGESLWGGHDIKTEILSRLPVSIELGLLAILTAAFIAIPVGTYSALRQDSAGDYVGRTLAIIAISAPSFWVATLVIVYPSIWWGWTPALEYIPFSEDPLGNLLQFIIPGVLVGMVMSGTDMRLSRTMMLEVLRQDYIRTAWAKGLRERVIVLKHALKNAMIPVVTDLALLLPMMIGGMVVIETIFVLPGMGRYFLDSIRIRDYPVVSAVSLMVATFVVIVNLLVDLTYGWLDPRVVYK
jgi:peptide/nickel transport system permease protein